MEQHKLSPENQLKFIMAGHALFTVRNSNTGNRFTYKVTVPGDQKAETARIWFVAGLTGNDNEHDYSYIGYIKNVHGKLLFSYGAKSHLAEDAPIVVAFDYVFNKLLRHGFTKPNLEVWHEGKCCRCGRTLTVPESIESGIGPECAKIKHKRHENTFA